METFQWRKLPIDGRGHEFDRDSEPFVINDPDLNHVFMLGGTIGYGRKSERSLFRHVYKLSPDGWIKLSSSFNARFGVIQVPLEDFHQNNWPQLDVSKLKGQSKLY